MNDLQCTPIQFVSSTEIRCTAPAIQEISNIQIKIQDETGTSTQQDLLRTAQWLGNRSLGENDAMLKGLNGPSGLLAFGQRLWIGDASNERVVAYDSPPSNNYASPHSALGQTSLFAKLNLHRSARGFIVSRQLATNGTHFAAGDSHRVLLWNQIPSTDGAPADLVLGQPDFSTSTPNIGGSATASTLNNVSGVAFYGQKLIVSDAGNHRVLIWNTFPTSNFQPADVVLGQANFVTRTSNTPSRSVGVSGPRNITVTPDGKLIVADRGNHRILIWTTFPTSSGVAANIVLGQTLFTTATQNLGGISKSSLLLPTGVWSDGTRLIVGDAGNNRILIWNTFPTTNKQAASTVLGQTSESLNTDPATLSTSDSSFGVYAVASDGTKLYASDTNTDRVLVWNQIPNVDSTPADFALGQPDLFSSGLRNPNSDRGMISPASVIMAGNALVVSDVNKHRILIYNPLPTSDDVTPTTVLGQTDLTGLTMNGGNPLPSASTLNNPRGTVFAGGRLFVSDRENNRILIWNSLPATNNAPADLVLGQNTFQDNILNEGGVSASSLARPQALASDGTKLFAVDTDNNRILIWNTLPTSPRQPADVVLGQPDMISRTENNGGVSRSSLKDPYAVAVHQGKLAVVDYGNNRILVWNTIPTANGTPADFVLGQSDATLSDYNRGQGIGQPHMKGFANPTSVSGHANKIYVTDANNDRIVVFDLANLSDDSAPIKLFNQPDYVTYRHQPLTGLHSAWGTTFYQDKMIIADYLNNRVLITAE